MPGLAEDSEEQTRPRMAPCMLGYPENGGGWDLGFYLGATFQWKPKFSMKVAPHASPLPAPAGMGDCFATQNMTKP